MNSNIEDLILNDQFAWNFHSSYSKPNIPQKKISGALSYVNVHSENIFVLIDDTVFGGAKDGMAITNNGIFCHEIYGDSKFLAWNDIKVITAKGSGVLVNDKLFYKIVMFSKSEVLIIANQLNEIINTLSVDNKTSMQEPINEHLGGASVEKITDKLKKTVTFQEFFKYSYLHDSDKKALYLFPKIPTDKLMNAIQSYAPNTDVSAASILIDETLWGSCKEGMLITNEKIILSKKFGYKQFNFNSIDTIAIKDKCLIINDKIISKFEQPALMHLMYIGGLLNNYLRASRSSNNHCEASDLLDADKVDYINQFLTRFNVPKYFSHTPENERKRINYTVGFALPDNITKEEEAMIRFIGELYSNEKILSISWIDRHDCKDEFFCVTDRGIRWVINGQSVDFISYVELSKLQALEEFNKSVYNQVRLSNNIAVRVSISNRYIRPYGLELISGLIDILNSKEPKDSSSFDEAKPKEVVVKSSISNLLNHSKLDEITYKSLRELEKQDVHEMFLMDELIKDQISILIARQSELKRSFINKENVSGVELEAEIAEMVTLLFMILHFYSLSNLPKAFKEAFGEDLHFLNIPSIMYVEAFRQNFESIYGKNSELNEDICMILPMAFFHRDGESNFDFTMPREEVLYRILDQFGISTRTAEGSIRQFERAVDKWLTKLFAQMVKDELMS